MSPIPCRRFLQALCLLIGLSPAGAQEVPPEALQAVGAVGVADVYMSWMAIGAVCDAFVHENEGYDGESVASILQVMVSLMTAVRESLEALLAAGGLTDTDTEVVTLLVQTYEYLALQARTFLAYLRTGDPGEYEAHRSHAWGLIERLYGVSDGE